MRDFFYIFVQFMFRVIFRLFFWIKVTGRENVPKTGAYIIASNHLSNLDPPMIGCFVPRNDIFYMAKEEMFQNKIWSVIFKNLKMFPVKRGAVDREALKNAFNVLEEGHCLLIFPEGTRRKGRQITPKRGLGFLCVNSGAKIIPARVFNSDTWFRFKRLRLVIGKPIEVDCSKDYKDISRDVLDVIEAL